LTVVGAGEGYGGIDGPACVVGGEVELLTDVVIGVFVDSALRADLEVLSDVERDFHRPAKSVGHTS
jgi:hypothetical protein